MLALCIAVVLGNVLDSRTYKVPNQPNDEEASTLAKSNMLNYEINDIPCQDRLRMCYSRGLCLDIFRWFRSSYDVRDKMTKQKVDLPSLYFHQILVALNGYKFAAEKEGLPGTAHCSAAQVRSQIKNVVELDPQTDVLFRDDNNDQTQLIFSRPETDFVVKRLNVVYAPGKYSLQTFFLKFILQFVEKNFLELGKTFKDSVYFNALGTTQVVLKDEFEDMDSDSDMPGSKRKRQ